MTGSPTRAPAQADQTACSRLHDRAGTSAYGTAAQARFWVALEQHGPWGRDAPTQSQLDPALGAALADACAAAGGRLLLIRPPGPHAHPPAGVVAAGTVLIGYAGPAPWLLHGLIDDPASLLRLDWRALGAGDRAAVRRSAGWATPSHTPMLLVCTNGKRDLCCAVRARPVALGAAAQRPGQVWECSHTGGHRLAPTGVLLPVGRVLARLDADLAVAALAAAADRRLPLELLGPWHDRGCSALSAPAQAAESAVRAHLGETAWAAVLAGPPRAVPPDLPQRSAPGPNGPGERVLDHPVPREPQGPAWEVTVRHTDGRAWVVRVESEVVMALPESCGREPAPRESWRLADPAGLTRSRAASPPARTPVSD